MHPVETEGGVGLLFLQHTITLTNAVLLNALTLDLTLNGDPLHTVTQGKVDL